MIANENPKKTGVRAPGPRLGQASSSRWAGPAPLQWEEYAGIPTPAGTQIRSPRSSPRGLSQREVPTSVDTGSTTGEGGRRGRRPPSRSLGLGPGGAGGSAHGGRVRTTPLSSGCTMAGAPGSDPPMGGGLRLQGRSAPVLGRGNPASLVSPRAKRSAPGARAGSQEGAQNRSMKANQPMGAAVHRVRPRLAGGG